LYSSNATRVLLSLVPTDKKNKYYDVDLNDEVTCGAILTYNGQILPNTLHLAPLPALAAKASSPANIV